MRKLFEGCLPPEKLDYSTVPDHRKYAKTQKIRPGNVKAEASIVQQSIFCKETHRLRPIICGERWDFGQEVFEHPSTHTHTQQKLIGNDW